MPDDYDITKIHLCDIDDEENWMVEELEKYKNTLTSLDVMYYNKKWDKNIEVEYPTDVETIRDLEED